MLLSSSYVFSSEHDIPVFMGVCLMCFRQNVNVPVCLYLMYFRQNVPVFMGVRQNVNVPVFILYVLVRI